jgi:hypothetical protein
MLVPDFFPVRIARLSLTMLSQAGLIEIKDPRDIMAVGSTARRA